MRNLTFLLAVLFSTTILAQDTFVGTIEKEITYENMSPEIKAYAAMLPSTTTVTVDKNLSKTVTPTGMGETIILSDSETGDMITLINQAGNLIGVRSNVNEDKPEEEEEPEIEYTDETKEILGYTCKKAIITTGENEIIVFYTDELPNIEVSNNTTEIDGFVMETTLSREDFTMTTTVKVIKEEKVKKIKMQIPAEYKEMTLEEIKAMQSGGM